MNNYRYRACVNLNPKFQKQNEERLHQFYDSVRDMLIYWRDRGPYNKLEETLYRMLYENSEVYPANRRARLDKNIRALTKTIECRNGHACCNHRLCPVCLSFWRYGVAAVIQRAVQTNPKIRLVMRQETFLMPRGVYVDRDDPEELHLMLNRKLNPAYELPVGSKYSHYWIWKFLDDEDRKDYLADPDLTSDRYGDVFSFVWSAIGGSELLLSIDRLNDYPKWPSEEQERVRAKLERARDIHKNNIKTGKSDPLYNPLMVELMSRMKRLDVLEKDSMGSVQRVMMIPSMLNQSTLLLRLDSLFLDTREHYRYVKEKYDELADQKKFIQIQWPGTTREMVWHPRHKSVMVCRSIPSNMKDILKIVESRFSNSCNLYPRLKFEEFPFFLNCLADKMLTKKTGFFREEDV